MARVDVSVRACMQGCLEQ